MPVSITATGTPGPGAATLVAPTEASHHSPSASGSIPRDAMRKRCSGSAVWTRPACRSLRASPSLTRQIPSERDSSCPPVSRRNGVAAGRASTSEKRDACAGAATSRPAATSAMIPAMRAYVGLGANLGDRERTLRAAVEALAANHQIEVLAVSSLRETDPVGPVSDQPRFLNGAVALETSLSARELLNVLLRTEAAFGRTREGPPGGPRTLDLDLLIYGEAEIDEPGLRVPHPRLHERTFVLEPLDELGWTPSDRGYTARDEPPR